MANVNITHRFPDQHRIVQTLGRRAVLELGRLLWRILRRGIDGEDDWCSRIVSLILAEIRREAAEEHLELVVGEFDAEAAQAALDRHRKAEDTIAALPGECKPPGALFWVYQGSLYASKECGMGLPDRGAWRVDPLQNPEMFARLLGGRFRHQPPDWWLGSIATRADPDPKTEGER